MKPEYPLPGLYIAGEWIFETKSRDNIAVTNPSTGEELARLPVASAADIDRALEAAHTAFDMWKRTPALDRAIIVRRAAQIIRDRSSLISATIARELGKPLPQAVREVESAAEMFEWAAEECRRSYGRIIPARAKRQQLQAIWEPVGPIAAFSPWNAPAITPARKISGALAAGCSIILKAAEETPATAMLIVKAAQDAGLPPGVLNLVFGNPAQTSQHLLSSPTIRALTFTGSTPVGRQLASLGGSHLKRMTLELGGHAPVLVFDDCDVEAVATAAVAAKFRNAGQICTSPTRFYIQENVFARFRKRFCDLTATWRVGDPFDPQTQMGPVATPRRLEAMQRFTDDAHARNLPVIGGQRLAREGTFFAPTTFMDEADQSLAANEEPFGPIAILQAFKTVDEVLERANRLPQALAAYAFSHDARIHAVLRDELHAGTIAINQWQASWPETPFGGYGDSGFGVEGGVEGLQAFQQIKFIGSA